MKRANLAGWMALAAMTLGLAAETRAEDVRITERVAGLEIQMEQSDINALYSIEVGDGATTATQTVAPNAAVDLTWNRTDCTTLTVTVTKAVGESSDVVIQREVKTRDALALMLGSEEAVDQYLDTFEQTAQSLGMTEEQKELYLKSQRINALRQAALKTQAQVQALDQERARLNALYQQYLQTLEEVLK